MSAGWLILSDRSFFSVLMESQVYVRAAWRVRAIVSVYFKSELSSFIGSYFSSIIRKFWDYLCFENCFVNPLFVPLHNKQCICCWVLRTKTFLLNYAEDRFLSDNSILSAEVCGEFWMVYSKDLLLYNTRKVLFYSVSQINV